MLLIRPVYFGLRDRIWYQKLMQIIIGVPGIGPLLADATFFSVALVLSHAVMRLIAGPARKDPLARSR